MKVPSLLALAGLVLAAQAPSVQADSKSFPDGLQAPVTDAAAKGPAVAPAQGDGPSIGTTYCTAVRNSTDQFADLTVLGSDVALDDSVTLLVTGLPVGSFGVFLTSPDAGFVARPMGSKGNICVRRSIGRFLAPGQVKMSDAFGTISLDTAIGEWSTQSIPRINSFYPAMAGQRTHFQLWYRDRIGSFVTTNFSDAEYVDWR